jgi:hypothetical protein
MPGQQIHEYEEPVVGDDLEEALKRIVAVLEPRHVNSKDCGPEGQFKAGQLVYAAAMIKGCEKGLVVVHRVTWRSIPWNDDAQSPFPEADLSYFVGLEKCGIGDTSHEERDFLEKGLRKAIAELEDLKGISQLLLQAAEWLGSHKQI